MFRMKLGRLRRMVSCVVVVTLRRVGVVSCRLMVACFVMLCRFMMMLRGMFVVLGCFAMVLCCFLGHVAFSFPRICKPREIAGLQLRV
jgi:hypothetical protein